MKDRKINPVVKQVLELGPTAVFLLFYLRLRDQTFTLAGTEYSGFIVAALIFVPILLFSMGVLWALSGSLSRMQVFTAFMVIFFGGLTAWFNDERFFKMKTTIVYGALAAVLAFGLWRGNSYLKWIMGSMLPMQDQGWMILTRRVAMIFAALAVANEALWRTQSTDTWVWVESFIFPVVLMTALATQIFAVQKYFIDEDEPPKE
jgi:intracellular septation protein